MITVIDKILFEILQRLDFNQAQLAHALGVSPQTVGKWKSRNKIPKNTKILLNNQYGISLSYLDTGEGEFYDEGKVLKNDASDGKIEVKQPEKSTNNVHLYDSDILHDQNVEYFQTKNNDFKIVNTRIFMKVHKVPLKAHAQYVDEFYNNSAKDVTFDFEWVNVDTYGKGEYRYFEVQGDSMDGPLKTNTPDGAMVLAREIGAHLWSGGLYTSKHGHIIITSKNILFKDIISLDKESMSVTLHSRNEDKNSYPDFQLPLGFRQDEDHIKQIFKVIKRDNM